MRDQPEPAPAGSALAGTVLAGQATAQNGAVPDPAGVARAARAGTARPRDGGADQGGPDTADGTAGGRIARGRGGHTGPHQVQRSRKKRPASVKLAFSVALVLVLAVAAALAYVVLHSPAKARSTALPKATRTTSPQPSPTLGVYGHIGSRAADPLPLTVAQLYPAAFTIGQNRVTRTASRESRSCAAAVAGANLSSAIGAAGCSQVVRATYLAAGLKMMGTIGVFNLKTGSAAKTAAKSAGSGDFVAQLRGRTGPTSKIGRGTGIEEAAAKGHYLILIWAEYTSLRKPRTAARRARLVQYMNQMLDKTANVSLANRMATGTP